MKPREIRTLSKSRAMSGAAPRTWSDACRTVVASWNCANVVLNDCARDLLSNSDIPVAQIGP